jgi:ADP-ribosyl-[dinitrogen reductase] hydrolase
MALCLADSLLAESDYDSYDVMVRYRQWWLEGYRSSTGVCFDIGNQTRLAIMEFEKDDGGWIKKDTPRSDSAGNGSVMRLAPVIIAAFEKRAPKEIIKMARISARETHHSIEAEIGTEVFAGLLIRAMQGQPLERLADLAELSTSQQFDDILHTITNAEYLDNSGYIIHSLQVAWWGLNNHKTFSEGMLAVVNLGGDSDTNGAIYGQLAGAFYGYESIPKNWRDELFQEPEIKALADRLIKMKSCDVIATRFEEDA